MHKTLILMGFLVLSGCAGGYNPPVVGVGGAPTGYRVAVAADLRSTLKDPASVRGAFISQPFVRQMGAGERWVVCIRLNAKNGFGGYSGQADELAVFADGRLVSISEATAGECREAPMTTFHEVLRS